MQIIGIDHGFGYMKTAHSVFTVNVTPWDDVEPPLRNKVLKYEGKYYCFGQDRKRGSKVSKTKNQDYYLMTLGAIAEELRTCIHRH